MWADDGLLAGDQFGGVADPLLALEHLGKLLFLGGRAERDVARAVVAERLGVDSQISTQAAISSCIAGWK